MWIGNIYTVIIDRFGWCAKSFVQYRASESRYTRCKGPKRSWSSNTIPQIDQNRCDSVALRRHTLTRRHNNLYTILWKDKFAKKYSSKFMREFIHLMWMIAYTLISTRNCLQFINKNCVTVQYRQLFTTFFNPFFSKIDWHSQNQTWHTHKRDNDTHPTERIRARFFFTLS